MAKGMNYIFVGERQLKDFESSFKEAFKNGKVEYSFQDNINYYSVDGDVYAQYDFDSQKLIYLDSISVLVPVVDSVFSVVNQLFKMLKITDASSTELKKLCEQFGIDYKGMSVDQMEQALGKVIWEKDHPGEEMPEQVAPMLISDITAQGEEWVKKNITKDKYFLQHKINGERFILQLNPDGSTIMTSRSKSVKTFRYNELDGRVLGLLNLKSPFKDGKTIWDGEIIMTNPRIKLPSGVETTSTLQSTVGLMHLNKEQSLDVQKKYGSLTFKVFDILKLNGENTQDLPYEQRSELVATSVSAMQQLNPGVSMEAVPVIKDFDDAWALFKDYVSQGGEGLVLKERGAKYQQGKRVKTQLKLKGFQTVDAFVTGFVPASKDKGLSNYIGGFKFSSYVDGVLREIAAVSNIDLATRKAATSYDKDGNPILNTEWLNKCAELIGQDWNEKSLRLNSARINEWREDKNPEDCTVRKSEMKFNTAI